MPRGERNRVARVEAGPDELLGPPVLDALHLGLGCDVEVSRSHTPGIRTNGGAGSPPAGGYQRMVRASSTACDLLKRPSSRSVRPPWTQMRTLPRILTGRSR